MIVCACCLFLATAAQAFNITHIRDYDEIIESGFLKVAVYEDYPPYSFVQDGEARGVDIELARMLAAQLGLELRLQWMQPDETFDGDLRNHLWKGHYLRPGQVADVMLRAPNDKAYSNMRDDLGLPAHELVHMFGPYQQERWQAAYNPAKIDSVPSIAIFQYHPVGVEEDSIPSFYLSTVMNGQIAGMTHNYRRLSLAFEAMKTGEVDAVMGTQAEIDWLLEQNSEAGMRLTENAYPSMGMQVWNLGMAVHDSNRQLAYALGDIVEAMVLDGRMSEIYASYGLRYMLPGYYAEL